MSAPKRRNYIPSNSWRKRSKGTELDIGMAGFLCTCNFRERECIRDAIKILETHADALYGLEGSTADAQNEAAEISDELNRVTQIYEIEKKYDDDDDISDALNKEIAGLKAEYEKPPSAKTFQAVDTIVKNTVFIKSTVADPTELALSIVKDLYETRVPKTRFVLRFMPIQVVCRASMRDIADKADPVFEKYFAQEPKTFCIVFNHHCNHTLERKEVIEELADLISKKNPGNKTDLKNPEIAVVVEILRRFCLLSIAPGYFKYKKYNLVELIAKPKMSDLTPDATPNDGKETPEIHGDVRKEPDDGGAEGQPIVSETSEATEEVAD